MVKLFLRRLLFPVIVAATLLSSSGIAADSPPANDEPAVIDVSSLTTFLNTLPPDEKDEQLRDWALYGLKENRGVSDGEEIPVRHPSLRESLPGEVSPGRVFSLSPKEWWLVIPREHYGNKPLIGGLVDRKYAAANSLPERVSLFIFDFNPASARLNVSFAGTIPGKTLYSPEYGFYSATVQKAEDFQSFAGQVDDLVMVEMRGRTLVLGGRKYGKDSGRAITLEEIAGLYQSYNRAGTSRSRKEYEAFVREKYTEMLRVDRTLAEAVRQGRIKKSRVLAGIRNRNRFNPEGTVGFSLDPERDYPALAGELEAFVRQHGAMMTRNGSADAAMMASRRSDLVKAAKAIRNHHNMGPFLSLRRKLAESGNHMDISLGEVLKMIEERNSYQAARYDGPLLGTLAGMELFYTDLLAKLWALNYGGIAPKGAVKGFRPMSEIAIPRLYWDDFVRLSATRLWFGLRQEGFELYGNRIQFQPVATRVYAASSDPLAPGRESPPNYQSGEFLGWWDRHYGAIADYEPHYHKLNQIQKWSTVFMVLKEKKIRHLDFLLDVPIARNLDFEQWSRLGGRYRTGLQIPFIDKKKYGRTTECLSILRSSDYRLMGRNYVLSGGVSLASRKDIMAKLRKQEQRSDLHSPADSNSHQPSRRTAAADRASKHPAAGTDRAAAGKQLSSTLPEKQRKPPEIQQKEPVKQGRDRSVGSKRIITAAAKGEPGTGKKQGIIKLQWDKGPAIAMHDFVAALAAMQQSNSRLNREEAIFAGAPDIQKAVRLKNGQTFLIKSAATKNDWIYLDVNPENVSAYPARASAALPDADIFCARLVTATDAEKLAAGKKVIK